MMGKGGRREGQGDGQALGEVVNLVAVRGQWCWALIRVWSLVTCGHCAWSLARHCHVVASSLSCSCVVVRCSGRCAWSLAHHRHMVTSLSLVIVVFVWPHMVVACGCCAWSARCCVSGWRRRSRAPGRHLWVLFGRGDL